MGDLNLAASKENLYILSGGAESVSYGGYLTGGGHAALASTFGMASDSVLEFEIVSPTGEFLTLNECQNQDLFWATRGVRASISNHSMSIQKLTSSSIGRRLHFWCNNVCHHSRLARIQLSVCYWQRWDPRRKPIFLPRHELFLISIPPSLVLRHN